VKVAKRCVACESTKLRSSPAVLMPFVAHRIFGWSPVAIDPSWGIRDLPVGTACSICKSMLCDECSMLFLDMRFDDDEMASLYFDYRGASYCEQRERFEPGYSARNKMLLDGSKYAAEIEAFLQPHLVARSPRVLDWGGDSGINTPFRGTAACHDILDISARPLIDGARAVARSDIEENVYDLVVYSNVLEHMPYPRQSLCEVTSAMRPNTLLYLEVPHEDVVRLTPTADARLEWKHHWHEHINFFTEQSLSAIVGAAGLKVADRRSPLITAGGKQGYVFSIAARRV
jgi:SAM-dependent methyltransferase